LRFFTVLYGIPSSCSTACQLSQVSAMSLSPSPSANFGRPRSLAFGARSLQAGFRTLTDLFALELWQRGEGRQEEISG
jgi:hypothetical protein